MEPLLEYGFTYELVDCPTGPGEPGEPPDASSENCDDPSGHATPEGHCEYYSHRGVDYVYLVGFGQGRGSFPAKHGNPSAGRDGWDYWYKYNEWKEDPPTSAAPMRFADRPESVVMSDLNRYTTKDTTRHGTKINHGPLEYSSDADHWSAFIDNLQGSHRLRGDGAVLWVKPDEMGRDGVSVADGAVHVEDNARYNAGLSGFFYYW